MGRSGPSPSPGENIMNRRQFLSVAGAGAAALALPAVPALAQDKTGFTLPKLPYDYDALKPSIIEEIMMLHHDKHHAAYVANLNKALEGHPDLLKKSIVALMRDIKEVPEAIQTAVINNGGGHANHSLFWLVMAPKGKGGEPSKELTKAIDDKFKSVDAFKTELSAKAGAVFGSGWAWLTLDKEKKLGIHTSPNQNSPYMVGHTPLMGIDVWEHAYYLQYKNVRPAYIKAWWDVVNWKYISDRYNEAMKAK
jgi:Fe-Mn family superoxide dismutase